MNRNSPRVQAARGNAVCGEKTRFIAIACILRPQGRHGEVSAELMTDFPSRFQEIRRVFLANRSFETAGEPGDALHEMALERSWLHQGRIVLKLGGIDSISQANDLRGFTVLIPFQERVQLPANTYYWREIEGCQVLTGPPEARIVVGTVTAIEPTGGVPLLHVDSPGRAEVLIPFAQDICREIDPEAKFIVIDPPEDLLDLNEPEKM